MQLSLIVIGAAATLATTALAAPAPAPVADAPPAHVLAIRDPPIPDDCHFKCYKGNNYIGTTRIWWGACATQGNGAGTGDASWACNNWISECGGACYATWIRPKEPDCKGRICN
ncbi:hypothetical protein HDU86_005149 [Geranomyces michiganensis]|nr:hypothetical protein HDU86_005149 [Geranomyces michiganensis]